MRSCIRHDVGPEKICSEVPGAARQEGLMTTECSALPALSQRQLARDKASRRLSNLALGKDMLIALAVLAGIGLVLSIGSSVLDLVALT
jgi:hypothetical protein